jgi:hypothetical protein
MTTRMRMVRTVSLTALLLTLAFSLQVSRIGNIGERTALAAQNGSNSQCPNRQTGKKLLVSREQLDLQIDCTSQPGTSVDWPSVGKISAFEIQTGEPVQDIYVNKVIVNPGDNPLSGSAIGYGNSAYCLDANLTLRFPNPGKAPTQISLRLTQHSAKGFTLSSVTGSALETDFQCTNRTTRLSK